MAIKLVDGTEWPDEDFHAEKARELNCSRAYAKQVNYYLQLLAITEYLNRDIKVNREFG